MTNQIPRFAFALLFVIAAAPMVDAQSHHHSASRPVTPAAMKQIENVKRAVAHLTTPEAAKAAGYEPVFGWMPMMGTHWVDGQRMLKGKAAVTLAEPSQLMFSPVNGKETLVGVAYAYFADLNDKTPPVLFDGAPKWHDHPDLAPPGANLLMLHAWFAESPDGPFAELNPLLPYWAAGATPPSSLDLKTAAASPAVRKGALALAEIVNDKGQFPLLARRPAVKPVLDEHRAAIRTIVTRLNEERSKGDDKAWLSLVDTLATHFDAMREAYLASALDPDVRARIARSLDAMIGGGHHH